MRQGWAALALLAGCAVPSARGGVVLATGRSAASVL